MWGWPVCGPSEDGPHWFMAVSAGHPFPQVTPHFDANP